MRTLAGKATILFDRDRGLRIELEDKGSGVTIVAQLDNDATVAALSRQAHVPCEIRYPTQLNLIGKIRESSTVFIDVTWEDYKPSRGQVTQACKDQGLLVNGWVLDRDGSCSQQNTKGKHRVVLERYIDEKE